MKKLFAPLSNNRGNTTIFSMGIVLLICVIIFLISTFFEYYSIIKSVQENMQAAILTVTTENYDETYFSKREGASGGYVRSLQWDNTTDTGAVTQQLKKILGLVQNGVALEKKQSSSKVLYSISNIQTTVYNTDFQSKDDIEAILRCRLTIPLALRIGLPAFKINLSVRSSWRQKY